MKLSFYYNILELTFIILSAHLNKYVSISMKYIIFI